MKANALMFLENEKVEPDDQHVKCPVCNAIVRKVCFSHHKKTRKHLEVEKFKHDLLKYVFEQIIG